MELLEWPELSLAAVSERVISGSAFPSMGGREVFGRGPLLSQS